MRCADCPPMRSKPRFSSPAIPHRCLTFGAEHLDASGDWVKSREILCKEKYDCNNVSFTVIRSKSKFQPKEIRPVTVLEAINLLGLDDHPHGLDALELAMARALEQTPRQRELLEEAVRCLSADLEIRASNLTTVERHPTREILLFDENRDAVMFGDETGPELPVSFRVTLVDDSSWMGDDSLIFEGEAAMMSEVVAVAPPVAPELSTATLDALPRPDTSISGEWQLMLESLEAEGLVQPEEGFSDALSTQIVALHDTPPERLAVNPDSLGLDSPIFALPETRQPAPTVQHAALLETPLFATPLLTTPPLTTPLVSPAQSETSAQPAFGLETPLFADSPRPTLEQAQVITFDESLLISHGGSLTGDVNQSIGQPASVAVAKSLETLPNRKMLAATPLSVKPLAPQPSEPPSAKQLTGRAGIAPPSDAPHPERRSPRSSSAQTATPRTYRDAREPAAPLRRRRQPVALWLLSVAALLGSAVFIAPNLAAQLRDQLLPRPSAPIKPEAAAVAKPQVRVVKPAAITPVQKIPSPSKTVKPAANKPSVTKPSSSQPSVTKPSASQPILSPKLSTPRAPAVVSAAPSVPAPRAAPPVKAVAPARPAPRRVTAPISSVTSLPPVTRPEGFASAGVTKPVSKPVVSVKPAVKLVPKPAPAPAPVASIEYRDQPATSAAAELPGGLTRQEFGRQFLNRKQFEVWQSQQLGVRFESFAQIPLETQVLEADAFRSAVLIPAVRPTRPDRP